MASDPGWYYFEGDQRWWDGTHWSDSPPPGSEKLRLSDREMAKQRKRAEIEANQRRSVAAIETSKQRAQTDAAAIEAELAARDAAEAARATEEEFAASPVGQARAAFEQGDGFFELEIELNRRRGPRSRDASNLKSRQRADLLSQIEAEGFRLEHVGYVFIETGSLSGNRSVLGMYGNHTNGFVQAIYLFRRVEPIGDTAIQKDASSQTGHSR